MLKIPVTDSNIERALKALKRKVFSTKQNNELRERKSYSKPSEIKRKQLTKAKYIQDKDL